MSLQLSAPSLDSPATLQRWLINPGVAVTVGQPVAILVTSTAELAIPAAVAGTVSELLVAEGEPVAANAPIGRLAAAAAASRLRITPLARRIAADLKVDLSAVVGSGAGGVIRKQDIVSRYDNTADRAQDGGFCVAEQMGNSLGAGETPIIVAPPRSIAPPRSAAPPVVESRPAREPTLLPWPEYYQSYLEQVNGSNATIPHAISALVASMAGVEALCRAEAAGMARRGITLTPTACLVAAALRSLAAYPQLAAAWAEDEEIRRVGRHLAVQHAGVISLLPNATDLSLQGIARALSQPDGSDLRPTFSIIHSQNAWWSAPLVAPGQAAVLHVGATSKAVVARSLNGFDQVVIEPVATLTLAYDARLISDDLATAFLNALSTELAA
jgi:pyruvate dehydrogenase E2 component (dihydrolipoamide acetyltransferase)